MSCLTYWRSQQNSLRQRQSSENRTIDHWSKHNSPSLTKVSKQMKKQNRISWGSTSTLNLMLNDLQNDFELPTRTVKRRAKSLSVRLEAESERNEFITVIYMTVHFRISSPSSMTSTLGLRRSFYTWHLICHISDIRINSTKIFISQ